MTTAIASELTTPDQFAALPNSKVFELIDGQLVERKMGNKSSWVAGQIFKHLGNYVDDNGLGWVFISDNGFRLDPERPTLIRRPDVSFVRAGRLPNEEPSDVYDRLAPDLAIEVISPTDIIAELDEKVNEYLAAGVRLVWVIHPTVRRLMVHRIDGTLAALRAGDELSGEDVIPGFRCLVEDLFKSKVIRKIP